MTSPNDNLDDALRDALFPRHAEGLSGSCGLPAYGTDEAASRQLRRELEARGLGERYDAELSKETNDEPTPVQRARAALRALANPE